MMDAVDTSTFSRSQRLHEALRYLIAATKPGERLPSEPKLARRLGVSRATLREAMRTFETQGLIRRRQGSGTFVMHPTSVIESGLEVLESIETMAERIGLQVSLGEMKIDHRTATPQEATALGLSSSEKILDISRVILAERSPAAYLVDILPGDILSPEDLQTGFTGSVLDLLLHRGSPDLLTSRCEITAVNAPADVARALGIQRGDVLLQFVAYLYSADGKIVDYSYSYFLPGYFRFHVVRKVNRE
jgi:GntR family transcriptional regulator